LARAPGGIPYKCSGDRDIGDSAAAAAVDASAGADAVATALGGFSSFDLFPHLGILQLVVVCCALRS